MSRPLRAVIHTQSLQHNLQRVRELAPDSKIMAVIKANAYGHGIADVARALASADALAVASIDEANAIRESLADCPGICLLEGIFAPEELLDASRYGYSLVVHCAQQVEWLEQASLAQPVEVWLKLDTGMNRLGIDATEFESLFQKLNQCSNVSTVGLMSHFACADDTGSNMNDRQLDRFKKTVGGNKALRSMANSAGIVQWPGSHFDWVRPGIMLYGSSPVQDKSAEQLGLQPVMTLTSELVAVRGVKRGQSVGYGATWTAERDTTVGVIACGYGDGYPRHAKIGTPVMVNSTRVPLIGRVSMDMITVDLAELPGATIGDPVTMWGEGLSVDEIADHAGTISYEILCHVTQRVPRVVV